MSSGRTGFQHAPREGIRSSIQVGSDVHFTIFIRVPVPRGEFVDPEPVDWNVSNDQALWKFLSQTSKGGEIDWRALAETYNVTLPFLLQQAAWLYEQQLSQVRAQMRKVASPQPTAPLPIPGSVSGSDTVGGQSMGKVGSGGAGSRAASSLSRRSNDTPLPKRERGMASTSVRSTAPPLSGPSLTDASSSNVGEGLASSRRRPARHHGQGIILSANEAGDHHLPITSSAQPPDRHIELRASSPLAKSDRLSSSLSSSSSDSEPREATTKSQLFPRRAHFTSQTAPSHQLDNGETDDDEDDEESPAFLPFSSPASPSATQDPSATLRIDTPTSRAQNSATSQPIRSQRSQTTHSSASSASSAAAVASTGTQVDGPLAQRPPGPLSPRRAAELAALSPRRRALTREGSDGTPSMGSSFSDLDDASVTQSALEEALLSNMQHGGGVASRMSSISQALKSRYL